MATINTPIVVDASAGGPIFIVELSSTLALCIYQISNNIKARTITIGADNSLTANAEANIDTLVSSGADIVMVGMTSTTAMLVYDVDATDKEARILSVSGTTVTANSPTTLTDGRAAASDLGMALIDSTNILYCYDKTGGAGVQAVVLSVSGITITENSIISVGSAAIKDSVKCSVYSSSRAIVVYVVDSTARMEGTILSISGTTLTANTEKNISTETVSLDVNRNYCINMSATKAVAGFVDPTDRINFVLTLNGTTFNIGTKKTDVLSVAADFHGSKISSTGLITVTETSSNDMRAVVYSITGGGSDELTEDSTDVLALSSLSTIVTAPVDTNRIIVLYFDSTGLAAVTVSAVSIFSGYDLVLGGGQP